MRPDPPTLVGAATLGGLAAGMALLGPLVGGTAGAAMGVAGTAGCLLAVLAVVALAVTPAGAPSAPLPKSRIPGVPPEMDLAAEALVALVCEVRGCPRKTGEEIVAAAWAGDRTVLSTHRIVLRPGLAEEEALNTLRRRFGRERQFAGGEAWSPDEPAAAEPAMPSGPLGILFSVSPDNPYSRGGPAPARTPWRDAGEQPFRAPVFDDPGPIRPLDAADAAGWGDADEWDEDGFGDPPPEGEGDAVPDPASPDFAPLFGDAFAPYDPEAAGEEDEDGDEDGDPFGDRPSRLRGAGGRGPDDDPDAPPPTGVRRANPFASGPSLDDDLGDDGRPFRAPLRR